MNRHDRMARGSVPVYNPAGQTVGTITYEANGTVALVKAGLDTHRHQLRQPPGWAVDADHIEQLRALGGTAIRLVCTDGSTWTASLAAFDRHGIALDRNHGRQVALALRQRPGPGHALCAGRLRGMRP